MTTIKLSGGSLHPNPILVRADLAKPWARVEIDVGDGGGWEVRRQPYFVSTTEQLINLAKGLAASAVNMPLDEFFCEIEVL